MSSAEWLPGAEWGSHFPVGVTSQPRRVPITRFHLCRRNLGQFTSGIYVRVLGGVFRSQSRVRDVGCGARSIDRAPSFCNSHFAIRNCIASAHTGIDPCDCKLPIVKWQMVFGAEWRSHFPVGVTFQPCRVPITLLHLCRRAWRCRRFVSRAPRNTHHACSPRRQVRDARWFRRVGVVSLLASCFGVSSPVYDPCC
jgi:hypothetical protein